MKNYNFVANLKKALIISLAIMLIGVVFNVIFGTQMDISFKGGTLIRYSYEEAPDLDGMTKAAQKHLGKDASLSFDEVNNTDVVTIKLPGEVSTEQKDALDKDLDKNFKDSKLEVFSSNTLSASMGTKFLLRCLLALGLAAILLVIYVGFRFRKIGGIPAAVSALIALVHDLLIVYFTFVIFGIELNDNFVAVMLTILGYSLNDTIVIFDRIRTMRRRSDAPLTTVVNDSLHHVLRRTIITTATTCLAILAVLVVALVMHVDSIISFALPMLLGSISGSYSSLFLSGPIWVRWMDAKEKKAAKKK
ncbi:MAG: protein translocase subunit SecF [Clostridia bacterium]|nr:protein translocase subunit SecF [Clostridia bacterium]